MICGTDLQASAEQPAVHSVVMHADEIPRANVYAPVQTAPLYTQYVENEAAVDVGDTDAIVAANLETAFLFGAVLQVTGMTNSLGCPGLRLCCGSFMNKDACTCLVSSALLHSLTLYCPKQT